MRETKFQVTNTNLRKSTEHGLFDFGVPAISCKINEGDVLYTETAPHTYIGGQMQLI